ncbi:formylglycine-generating enzyme family protein [Thioalkalivibrio paradoxus]|uniref:formylglycine-generating enzyme family protein n=1 Tax=Thioalkalivibrio paradoxus TaxID=108010 RepID=UPI00022C1AF0|nr:formylglycine-generating enzyme family protein [Thioalkalivibrio paradoxus]
MASALMHRLDTPDLLDLQQQAADAAGVPVGFQDRSRDGIPVPELRVIPAGEFEIGSDASEYGHKDTESPRRFVLIERPFALGRYPVTKAEFAAFQQATGWVPRRDVIWPKGDQQPVFNLRLADVEAYLEWLSAQAGQRYRLPTEAEWEFAARAGTRTAFAFGDAVGCRDVHFNSLFPYDERRERRKWYIPLCIPLPRAMDVGSFPPNRWGLHDMHGNVQEFTQTPWRDSHADLPRDGVYRRRPDDEWLVVKGGSWFDPAVACRSASRRRRHITEMDTNLGFRVLRELRSGTRTR